MDTELVTGAAGLHAQPPARVHASKEGRWHQWFLGVCRKSKHTATPARLDPTPSAAGAGRALGRLVRIGRSLTRTADTKGEVGAIGSWHSLSE